MTSLILIHGWGFDTRFWQGLQRHLHYPLTLFDLGFYGSPYHEPITQDHIVIGHSLGLMWALRHGADRAKMVISINGFGRFCADDDYPGTPPRVIERMKARFSQSPSRVAEDFLKRCGIQSPDSGGLESKTALAGLEWLQEWDEHPSLQAHPNVVALAGTHDPILPAALTCAAFAGKRIIWAEGGGHLLPLTHPQWCADHIRAAIGSFP